jgi:uncharacterized membrane protein YdjX (TVP38/TMEM64 family)
VLGYFVGLTSAAINFYLARRYGRTAVRWAIGEKGLSEVDRFVSLRPMTLLIALRIIGFPFFDYISYAVGLTTIRFAPYFIATALCNILPTIAHYFIFQGLTPDTPLFPLLFFGTSVVMGGLLGIFLWREHLKENSENRNN